MQGAAHEKIQSGQYVETPYWFLVQIEQHTKTYRADNEVETLVLNKVYFREAVDRTNNEDGALSLIYMC